MNQHEAFSSIEQIRRQLARVECFQGYRAATTAFTGVLAFAAAGVQWAFDLSDNYSFLNLWVTVAVIGIIEVGLEMTMRCLRSASKLQRDATLLAVSQFVPCLVAGLLLTIALDLFSPRTMHLLPGLWGVIFSLGIFASRPSLPRAANFVAAYYLLAGLFVIATTHDQTTFPIWPMPLMFGIGQLLAAAVLYISFERNHDAL